MQHSKRIMEQSYDIGTQVALDGFRDFQHAIFNAHKDMDISQNIPFHPVRVVALQQMYVACVKAISEMNDEVVKILRRHDDKSAVQMQYKFLLGFQEYVKQGNELCEHFLDKSIRDLEALIEDRGIKDDG